MRDEKPYGSQPQDPRKKIEEEFIEKFAGFHEKQVKNHKSINDVMAKQVEIQKKQTETIDKLATHNQYYGYAAYRIALQKWTVVAFSIAAGFFYLLSLVSLFAQQYILFGFGIVTAMYLTFMAVKKGSIPVGQKTSNIRYGPAGRNLRGDNEPKRKGKEKIYNKRTPFRGEEKGK